MKKHTEPELIKAGDKRILIPLSDVRILTEDIYQNLIKEINMLKEKNKRFENELEALEQIEEDR